jgi:hypothetical protein
VEEQTVPAACGVLLLPVLVLVPLLLLVLALLALVGVLDGEDVEPPPQATRILANNIAKNAIPKRYFIFQLLKSRKGKIY